MATSRFGAATLAEINEKRKNIHAKNTQKANQKTVKALREYLLSKSMNPCFEEYEKIKLNDVLTHYYIDARKVDGDKYKVSSMENIRYSLNRYVQGLNSNIDIIKDPEFRDCNVSFRAAVQELKREGKGDTQHHPALTEKDLKTIYNSDILQPITPCRLQNKVQFDIRFYFFRRGAENMHSMSKNTFVLKVDSNTGKQYVYKAIDELTKNHREGDKESSSGYMPENPCDPLCPVKSFKLYLSKLHPTCDKLWQRPRDSFLENETSWYCNVPVGQKTLSAFMTNICKALNISKYTNHSIRATGATLLSRSRFNNAQIMAVTGHKSCSSLAVYQRVNDEEKLQMGNTLSKFVSNNNVPSNLPLLTKETTNEILNVPSNLPLLTKETNNEDLFSALNLEDFDSFIGDDVSNVVQKPLHERPVFANCYIGNITINYNK